MKNNKLILSAVFLASLLGIASCGPTSQPTTEPSTEPPSSEPEPFVEDVESRFEEGYDYIEHSKTWKKGKYSYDPSMWYVNDLTEVPLPDPQVYHEDSTYYIVGTSDNGGARYIEMYSTEDFNTYKREGIVYNSSDYQGHWEADNPAVYAPELYCFDGVYYMYYSAVSKADGIRYNSVVKADSVLGPYEPIVTDEVDGLSNPLFVNGKRTALDSSIFVDDDGKMYMYYSIAYNGQYIGGVELKNPYTADWSTYRDLIFPGTISTTSTDKVLEWECYRGNHIVEGPFMIKSNGKYYLTYSANGCWNKYYNVCYAVSDSPLGDYVKPYTEGQIWTNLLMGYPGTNDSESEVYKQWSGFASGTGHHCFFNIGDQVMVGYHAHKNRDWNGGSFTPRYFALDYLYFDEEGVPYINGPSWSPQPLPEAISGYKNIAKGATIRTENVVNAEALTNDYIVNYYNLPGEDQKETQLGNGYSYIELTFDKEYSIAGFAVFNSVFYSKAVFDIKYVDFGNKNACKDLSFLEQAFTFENKQFIFPNSAFTVEFIEGVKSNKVTLCFDLENGGAINEIVVLGY